LSIPNFIAQPPIVHQLFPLNQKLRSVFFYVCKHSLKKNYTLFCGTLQYHTSFDDLEESGATDVLRLKIRAPAIFNN